MKAYLLPIALASGGIVLLLNYKSHSASSAATPSIPATNYTQTQSTHPDQLPTHITSQTAFSNAIANAQKRTAAFDPVYEFFHERLTYLDTCLDSQSCAFPNKDPKNYELSVYGELKTTLQTLKEWQKRHSYKDQRISQLMRRFLEYEDAEVKISALEILATQPPEDKNLDAIFENAIHYGQPEPIHAAMTELERYHSPQQKERIDEAMEAVLLRGAVNSAVEVAKNIGPLLDRENVQEFRDVLKKLKQIPLSEDIYTALNSSLNSFKGL